MGRPKKAESEVESVQVQGDPRIKIQPLTQEFGNGELNVLRDKVNEIIKSL